MYQTAFWVNNLTGYSATEKQESHDGPVMLTWVSKHFADLT